MPDSKETDTDLATTESPSIAKAPPSYGSAVRQLRPPLLVALGFSAMINVLMLTGSIYMLQVYDRVLTSGSVETLFGLFTIVAVLYGFLGFYDVLRRRILSRAAVRFESRLAPAAFDSWLASGLPSKGSGDSRALRDVETLRTFLSGPAATAALDMPFVPIFLVVLFLLHPWLGWIAVGGAGVTAVLALVSRYATAGAIQMTSQLETAEKRFAERSRTAAEDVAALGMRDATLRHWSTLKEGALAAGQTSAERSDYFTAGSRSLRMLLQSGILTVAALLVLRQEITAGMIIASSILSGRALAPIDQVVGQWRVFGRAHEAHKRLKVSLAASNEPAKVRLPAPEARLEVSRLTKFARVPGANEPLRLLSAVDFDLQAGDALCVVGKSGSGKSTLARMLTGSWQPDMGEVRLGGATLTQWDQNDLGRIVGYLPQMVSMLPGTVRDNIARMAPDAKDDDVIAAARLAGVHDMILRLPEGYSTRIGEDGCMLLSGGQLQRLALARAIFGMPKLVVLDEPNANLDRAGREALNRAIKALRIHGSTVVLMAHWPSAIDVMNKVLVLDGGRVMRFGSREEVLNGRKADGADIPGEPAKVSSFPRQNAAADKPGIVANAGDWDGKKAQKKASNV